MERPTDLYLADLMNQAADALLAPIQHPSRQAPLAEKLRTAAKAVRENPQKSFLEQVFGKPGDPPPPPDKRVHIRHLNPEQRFREVDGQGSFHDEKPR